MQRQEQGPISSNAKDQCQGLDPVLQDVFNQIFAESDPISDAIPKIKGYDFNQGINYENMFATYENVGHQATCLGKAIKILNGMIDCKLRPIDKKEAGPSDRTELSPGRPKTNCTIFLGYTSNMISSGTREILRYLVQHNMVDCIVSTAGGVEEDIMKCKDSFRFCGFRVDDKDMAHKNFPRAGNVFLSGSLYKGLYDFLNPILDTMLHEQIHDGIHWTPSTMIRRLGQHIDNSESLLYWAAVNNIPVFCPALTDGGIGDIMYFHKHRYGENSLRLDIIQDYRSLADIAVHSVNTGSLIAGSGIVKHHILNPNCYRAGLDFAVFVNTAQEFDGSDAGAEPSEAFSWMKIKSKPIMAPIKVAMDASIALPIMVAGSFAKRQAEFQQFYHNQDKSQNNGV